MKITISLFLACLFVTACSGMSLWGSPPTRPSVPSVTLNPSPTVSLPSETTAPFASTPDLPTATVTPTLAPEAWKDMPVVPQVSPSMREVYLAGLAAGRDPTRFSKIGDCQNIAPYFLAIFDDPAKYRLGEQYAYLQPVIDHFTGSWSRQSLAAHGGMNVAAVQNPFWTLTPRPADCHAGETPLACELRVYDPSIVIISMEESWSGDLGKYDGYMRRIVEYVLAQNVVPILATRAELPNPAISINATVARIAYDYRVPLWNFWAASNPLPSHGLTEDGFHLTGLVDTRYYFDDPVRMEMGWTWRNLTALQAITAVYRALSKNP